MFELAQHGVTVLVVNFIKVHITDKRFCNFMKKLLTRSDQDIHKYPHLIGIRPRLGLFCCSITVRTEELQSAHVAQWGTVSNCVLFKFLIFKCHYVSISISYYTYLNGSYFVW